MLETSTHIPGEQALRFLRRKASGELGGVLCGLVLSGGLLGALGWGLHLWMASGMLLFQPSVLSLIVVVALVYALAFGIGAVTADRVRTDEHLEDHLRGSSSSGSDEGLGEEMAGGCAIAIFQFLFGTFYTSLTYVVQGGSLPDRQLRLAATIVSILSDHPCLNTGDVQQALESASLRVPPEDVRGAIRFLSENNFICAAEGWVVTPEIRPELASA